MVVRVVVDVVDDVDDVDVEVVVDVEVDVVDVVDVEVVVVVEVDREEVAIIILSNNDSDNKFVAIFTDANDDSVRRVRGKPLLSNLNSYYLHVVLFRYFLFCKTLLKRIR